MSPRLEDVNAKRQGHLPGFQTCEDRTHTMAALARYLQRQFAHHCPAGWSCKDEVPLVGEDARSRLGFSPRADLMLEQAESGRRIWLEFEISRADPVANHAKFTTVRFFESLPRQDTFVSMVSRHVDPGRAALAAGTTSWMRAIGIPAFQVPLLPELDGPVVKHLNALPLAELERNGPSVSAEVARVVTVTNATSLADGHRIHPADNPWTVGLNVRRWNLEVSQPDLRALWGRRAVQYFAADPASGLFAPSKFCAYIPGADFRGGSGVQLRALDAGLEGSVWSSAIASAVQAHAMTLRIYSQLDEGDARFDGHIARRHLERGLGYRLVPLESAPSDLGLVFSRWHAHHREHVTVRGDVHLLLPPEATRSYRRPQGRAKRS